MRSLASRRRSSSCRCCPACARRSRRGCGWGSSTSPSTSRGSWCSPSRRRRGGAAAGTVQGIVRQDLELQRPLRAAQAAAGATPRRTRSTWRSGRSAAPTGCWRGALEPALGGRHAASPAAPRRRSTGGEGASRPSPSRARAIPASGWRCTPPPTRWCAGRPASRAWPPRASRSCCRGAASKEIYLVDSDGENVQRLTNDGSHRPLARLVARRDADRLHLVPARARRCSTSATCAAGADRVLSDRAGDQHHPGVLARRARCWPSPPRWRGTPRWRRTTVARDCCLQQQTRGRRFDSLSPSFSPDGRQIAFVSNRLGRAARVRDGAGRARRGSSRTTCTGERATTPRPTGRRRGRRWPTTRGSTGSTSW